MPDLGHIGDETAMSLSVHLRDELLRAGAPEVGREKVEAPPDSKSGVAQSIWPLVVSGLASAAMTRMVAVVAKAWLDRAKGRKLTLECGGEKLVLEGGSAKDQSAVVQAWIDKIEAKADSDGGNSNTATDLGRDDDQPGTVTRG